MRAVTNPAPQRGARGFTEERKESHDAGCPADQAAEVSPAEVTHSAQSDVRGTINKADLRPRDRNVRTCFGERRPELEHSSKV